MSVRLAHFTDPHVTERPERIPLKTLLSKRMIGWLNLRFCGRFSALAQAAHITRAAANDLQTLPPNHVVCTGDYTGLSLPSEFRHAQEALSPLRAHPSVTSIPGNHDVYVRSATKELLYESAFGEYSQTDLEVEDFPPAARTAYPYPLIRSLGEQTVLIVLRDARPTWLHDSSGKVPKAQLVALRELLGRPDLRQHTKILALHYGLRRADGSRDTYFHRLRNDNEVLRCAEEAGVALVIHGHIHKRFVLTQGVVSPVAMANPGALTYDRGAQCYHIYTIDDSGIHLEARRYDPASDQFVAWPEAPGSGLIWVREKSGTKTGRAREERDANE